MAQTADTFATAKMISFIPGLPGGHRQYKYAVSFGDTASSLTFTPPVASIVDADIRGAPMQITTGTTLDTLVLDNTMSADGLVTLISGALQFSRAGTNNQDAVITLTTK